MPTTLPHLAPRPTAATLAAVTALVVAAATLATATTAHAQSTIDPTERWAWSANLGWIDARPAAATGAVVGRAYCRGHLYAANAGWITLGDGSPQNGYAYSNATGTDSGVNFTGTNPDGTGRLRGLAWAANLGWIIFADAGNPRLDLTTGALAGHVWSANTGWIALGGFTLSVALDHLDDGPDADADGLPDPWEFQQAGALPVLAGGAADNDGDGHSNAQEYTAGTAPLDALDHFQIVDFAHLAAPATDAVEFTSKPVRHYRIETSATLTAPWTDTGLGLFAPDAGATTLRAFTIDPSAARGFFRVTAHLPLAQP